MLRPIIKILCAILPILSLAWALDLFREIGLNLFAEQFLAIVLGLSVLLALLTRNIKGQRRERSGNIPLHDICGAILGIAASFYLAVGYQNILETLYEMPGDAIMAGALLIVLTIEALRRSAGNALAIVAILFFVYGLFGHLVPGDLQGRQVNIRDLTLYLAIDSNGMLGKPLMITSTIVIMFILFGGLLTASGGGQFFTDISMAIMGRHRGGSAKIAVVASALFGSISGSAVANVASTGILTIPLMKESGFKGRVSAAIESVASTGGQLMPPVMGAAAFLMAELLQVGYDKIVIAALVPACIYFFAVFVQVDLIAAKHDISAVPEERIPDGKSVLFKGWYFVLPFAVLIGGLFYLGMRPETAALWATLTIILLRLISSYGDGKLSAGRVWDAVARAGEIAVDIVLIGAAAGLIIGILNITSLGFALTLSLIDIASGHLFLLLLLSALLSIILGMGMPTVGVYILLATVIAPSIIEMGVDPIAAHMFVLYFGMMSMISPPVAIAAFTASVIAGASPIRTALLAVRFGWTAFIIPFVFVFEPGLLLSGNVFDIVMIILRTGLGVWLISGALIGYLFHSLTTIQRILFFVVGVFAVSPGVVFPSPEIAVYVVMLIAMGCIFHDYRATPARKQA